MNPQELLILKRMKSAIDSGRVEDLCTSSLKVPIEEFTDISIFERELKTLFKKYLLPIAASDEIAKPGDFLCREVLGQSYILTRDKDKKVNIFRNVCKHRGAALLECETKGNQKAISCPYHAWTYDLSGKLIGVPEKSVGFPNFKESEHNLKPMPFRESAGYIWFCSEEVPSSFGALDLFAEEWKNYELASSVSHFQSQTLVNFNWKLGVNAFLEAYHFNSTHPGSVAPYYVNNRFVFDKYGENAKISLPMSSILEQFSKLSPEKWEFRKHVNLVYFIFPGSFIFVLPDHTTVLSFQPLGIDKTRVFADFRILPGPEKSERYWQKNIDLFKKALKEDFEISESIQRGLASTANRFFTLATFESPIQHFQNSLNTLRS